MKFRVITLGEAVKSGSVMVTDATPPARRRAATLRLLLNLTLLLGTVPTMCLPRV